MTLPRPIIEAQFRKCGMPVPDLRPCPRAAPIVSEYRSKLEADYAARLDALVWAGDVEWWVHTGFCAGHGRHPLNRLTILNVRHYTPDFIVMPRTGRWEMHEVKGYAWEKDRIRLDAVAKEYPGIPLMLVQRDGRGWRVRPWRAADCRR